MDFRIYARSKMAADSYSSTVNRAPGVDFSQILSHSVAGQGRQGDSDKYKDRVYDTSREKVKESPHDSYHFVNLQDLPLEAAQQFHQVKREYGIPVSPKELTFDGEGRLLLPASYPYAIQMEQALNESPELKKKIIEHGTQASSYAEVQAEVSFSEIDSDDAARARFEQMVMMSSFKHN